MTELENSNSGMGTQEIPIQRNAVESDSKQQDLVGDDNHVLEHVGSNDDGKEITGSYTTAIASSNFMESFSVPSQPPATASQNQSHSNGQRLSPPSEIYGESQNPPANATSQGQICR